MKIIDEAPYSNHTCSLLGSEQNEISINDIKYKEKILRDYLYEFNESIIKELEI